MYSFVIQKIIWTPTFTNTFNGSQIGSRNRSTISGNDNVITNKEEDSVASRTRNKRKRKHNKTIRRILTDQQQEDHVHWQRTSTEDDENNSYEY